MRAKAVPALLWVVVAVLAGAGGFMFWAFVVLLGAGARIFSYSGALGLALVLSALVIGFTSIGFFALAGGLFAGSRVARGLTYLLVSDLLLISVLSSQRGSAIVLVALGAVAIAAMLWLAPSVQAYFSGPLARATRRPSSIVVAEVVIVLWGVSTLLAALMMFLLSSVSPIWAFVGMLFLGMAGLAFWARSGLQRGNRAVRLAVSAAAVLSLVLVLASPNQAAALVFQLGMHLGLVAVMWLPAPAREHFGDAPLPLNVESALRRLATETHSIGAQPPANAAGPAVYPPNYRPVPPAPPAQRPCPRCGTLVGVGWPECPQCGTSTATQTPMES